MNTENDGGPAFPWGEHGTCLGGMTLRDYFAIEALSGMLSARSVDWDIGDDKAYTSKQAYQYADAMLAERAK